MIFLIRLYGQILNNVYLSNHNPHMDFFVYTHVQFSYSSDIVPAAL